MNADDIVLAVMVTAAAAISFGLASWVFRARERGRAQRGLYFFFGIPAAILLVAGAAAVAAGREGGVAAVVAGAGLAAALLRPVRVFLARWTPLDSDSAIDMAGLAVILAAIGFLTASYILTPEPLEAGGEVTIAAMLVQFLGEIVLAYILVGYGIVRGFREASARLGLVRPTWTIVGVAVGLVLVAFAVVLTGGILTYLFQPDVSEEIESITNEITRDVQNPIGAALFGMGAGAGEELLLRGAIQPRYGLLVTSVLFGLLHSQYGISFVLLGIFGVGVILGIERKYFGTTAAIITHAIFNMIAVLV